MFTRSESIACRVRRLYGVCLGRNGWCWRCIGTDRTDIVFFCSQHAVRLLTTTPIIFQVWMMREDASVNSLSMHAQNCAIAVGSVTGHLSVLRTDVDVC